MNIFQLTKKALEIFGNGFLSHPANDKLRERVETGETGPESFYRDLLRLVYRLLFLMVAEERGLISPSAVYMEHYSLERLRHLADLRLCNENHQNLWASLQTTFNLFRHQELGAFLQIPMLNGKLFEKTELDHCALYNRDLLAALHELSTYTENARSPRRRINYSALNIEELGDAYENLLDYHPAFPQQDGKIVFRLVPGTERKTTGSYYTPPELINELVKSALEPVLAERLARARGKVEKERAILDIKVCDPACGSGHFLLAAARRLGKELACVRTGDEEPAPEEVRSAVCDVISHCIYGVDKNPLAVDLCKVALWIEGHAEGRPFTFLDHRIRCGDALVGVFDLKVLEEGIPDEAFEPVVDDDKALAKSIKKDNKAKKTKKAGWLFFVLDVENDIHELSKAYRKLSEIPDDTPEQVREKQEAYERLRSEESRWWRDNTACHLWTAAFFARLNKDDYREKTIPTTEVLHNYLYNSASVDSRYPSHAWEAALRHRFFHWPLEFPEVFEQGGFDVVLCNPPWERIKLQEQEFFATRDPEIARAPNKAARERLIKRLPQTNPSLWSEYQGALHYTRSYSKFLRQSGRFPLSARRDINTYSVFSELVSELINPEGRAGVVVPTGIATDDTNKVFFSHLVNTGRLASLYDFQNREKLFPTVLSLLKFSLLTIKGKSVEKKEPIPCAFFLTRTSQLRDKRRIFELTSEDFAFFNPNTRTCPIFRTRQDAELTRYIYRRMPVLVNEATGENPWGIRFSNMFDMSNDSHLFRTRRELEEAGFRLHGNRFVKGEGDDQEIWLPLYEAKMIHQFDHRFGTYHGMSRRTNTKIPTPTPEQHADPCFLVEPWYWVEQKEVNARLGEYGRKWLLGFRDIARATDERTAIFTVIPQTAVGDNLPLLLIKYSRPVSISCILSNFNTLILDFIAKQKIAGTHLNFFYVEQFPLLGASNLDVDYLNAIIPRLLEQIYTAWDIKPFADDVWREADEDLRKAIRAQWEENKRATGGHAWDPPEWAEVAEDGIPLPPFKWDEERRARLRAELDAIYAKLYGLNRKQLRYILDPADLTEKELENILDDYEEVEDPLDEEAYRHRCETSTFPGETFRILKEKEIKKYGFYRTRRLVLEAWEKSNKAQKGKVIRTSPEGLLVCELFAGIGGFRLGLEKAGHRVIWSNQWEPATKRQNASECYVAHFGAEGHSNEDICKVHVDDIPEHDLLVGGFPCQDYSVAATKTKGIHGKKGVLWWEINRILRAKRPPYVLLENVDRLLKSPASQRGRDFGIMLACFRDLLAENDLGYSVEWRVINAADYGFAQRRRRLFIFAFRDDTPIGESLKNTTDWHAWLLEKGFFASEFPATCSSNLLPITGIDISYPLEGSLMELSDGFRYPFQNAGIMSGGRFYTIHVEPIKEPFTPLSAVLEEDVSEDFYIPESSISAWRYAKGAKSEPRRTKSGYEYYYKEGAIPFPDDLSKPARTILTSEGSRSPNRCTHIIKDPQTDRLRRLTPVEVERIFGFPDGWTDTGMTLSGRYFCLGNSLVVGLIERMGKRLSNMIFGTMRFEEAAS